MADEQQAIAPSGQETATAPEVVNETVNTEPERIPGPEEAAQEVVEDADDDSEEVDWNGKKFRGPKGLKDGILMHADYTRKRQADAETASQRTKALDAREAQIEERTKAADAELDLRVNLRHVNAEIERFKAFDWNAYQAARQTDPMGADEAWNYAQHMRNQKAELEGKLGDAQTARTQEAQRDLAKRVEEAGQWASANIKGWSPELEKKVIGFAIESDIPRDFLAKNMSPKLLETLHFAHIGKELLKNQSAVPKPAATIQPLATVNGKSPPSARVSLADADMDAYVAARKRGVGGKALR